MRRAALILVPLVGCGSAAPAPYAPGAVTEPVAVAEPDAVTEPVAAIEAEPEPEPVSAPPAGPTLRAVTVRTDGDRAVIEATVELAASPRVPLSQREAYPLAGPPQASLVAARLRRFDRPFTLLPTTAASAVLDALEAAPVGDALGGAMRLSRDYVGWMLDVIRTDREPLDVALTFDAATCQVGGHRYVWMPSDWRPHLAAAAVHTSDDVELFAACQPGLDDGHNLDLLDLGPESIAPDRQGQRIATAGRQIEAATTTFAQVDVALDPALTDVPTDAQTVLVFDGSWSAAPTLAAQLAVAQAYLAATPRGRAAAVVVNRTAVRATGWMPTRDLGAMLDDAWLRPLLGNGSNLDAGLARASSLLANARGTRRVVAFTDGLVASALETAAAGPRPFTLPADVALLLVQTGSGDQRRLTRDDTAMFGGWVARDYGLSLSLADDDAAATPDVDLLLRPRSLDALWLDAPGWDALSDGADCLPLNEDRDAALAIGRSCRWRGATRDASPRALTLRGAIWHRPWQQVVDVRRLDAAPLARDLLALGLVGQDEVPRAALVAKAASVTEERALLVTWGGHGGDGEPAGGGMGRSSGICGCPGPGGIGHGWGTGTLEPALPDSGFVEVARLIAACQPEADGASTEVVMETTADEIVAIQVRATRAGKRVRAIERCAERVLWAAHPAFLAPGSRRQRTWRWTFAVMPRPQWVP